jgi:ribosomal protein L12E/L44/L45/RPP1/RPP2
MVFVFQSATEPSNGLLDKQEDDANGEEEEEEEEEDEDEEEEEKTSPGKKLWRFLIT